MHSWVRELLWITFHMYFLGADPSVAFFAAEKRISVREINQRLSKMRDVSSIVPANFESVKWASEILHSGRLVSFPTETVYGLGANAASPSAILSIFKAKERPLTDPLIVHVSNLEQALQWSALSSNLTKVVRHLAGCFWPGPLTLVLPKANFVSDMITAGSNSVALRVPQHPVALALLQECNLALVAPSANKFGHVSPTSAQHVMDDLGHEGVFILDGGPCEVGIESTILKLSDTSATILRKGLISAREIAVALCHANFSFPVQDGNGAEEVKDVSLPQDCPGQLLTHYAPRLPTWQIKGREAADDLKKQLLLQGIELRKCVAIDVLRQLHFLRNEVAQYVDIADSAASVFLSPTVHDVKREVPERMALANAFLALRWAEVQENCEGILLPYLGGAESEMLQSLQDRLFRSSSGKIIILG